MAKSFAAALLVLFVVSFFVACIHQFYFVLTAPFLQNKIQLSNETGVGMWINRIFGVGGGGLMTIGQISELVVLAVMPFVVKSRAEERDHGRRPGRIHVRFAVFAVSADARGRRCPRRVARRVLWLLLLHRVHDRRRAHE